MTIRPYLPALFVLVLAIGSVTHGLQTGHLNLPEIILHVLLAGFLGWHGWKSANDKTFGEYQAQQEILRWEESTSAALMFFCGCLVLFVPLMAIASLHPQTFQYLNLETLLFIAPVAAAAVGLCRFFLWR